MEPVKFEKYLKDKLEQRELQPSSKAWNTLKIDWMKPIQRKVIKAIGGLG